MPTAPLHSDQQLFTGTGACEGPISLPVSTTKLQSPASWCHQGQRSRRSRAVGEGREGPPRLPPHSCTGMKPVIFTQGRVGWRGRAPKRWSSWKEDLKKQRNKIPILREDKKNLNIPLFFCLFQPLPSPLVCIFHLHFNLTRPLQGKKDPFHHKGDTF